MLQEWEKEHDKNLESWIDMKEGKITQEKYNEIRFTI